MTNEDIVNKSGFPLQIAVENLIGGLVTLSEWRVIYTEHAWKSENDSGFIDLILELSGGVIVLVIECKRVLNFSWLFLHSQGALNSRRQTKAWISQWGEQRPKQFYWRDLAIEPSSPECEYSVVLGQDHKSKPMLERTAATLVASTEAFASEEYSRLNQRNHLRVYFNVIITTAKLEVCTFEQQNLSTLDGTIAESKFEEVPYLRFRKQLQNNIKLSQYENSDYHRISRAKENSVFIVNSNHIVGFLNEFDLGHQNILLD